MDERVLPEHFRDDGRAKEPLTYEQAARLTILEDRAEMRAYPCSFCDAWHVAKDGDRFFESEAEWFRERAGVGLSDETAEVGLSASP